MLARLTPLSLILVAAVACQPAETAEDAQARIQMESDSVRVILEAKAAAFSAAVNAGNAEAVAAFYAPDAVLMGPDMPAVVGRDAIQGAMTAMAAEMPPGSVFTLRVVEVTANGPIAVDRGTWHNTVPTPDGGSMELSGKYLVEWHRIDGEWLMAADIWNSDAPLPPM